MNNVIKSKKKKKRTKESTEVCLRQEKEISKKLKQKKKRERERDTIIHESIESSASERASQSQGGKKRRSCACRGD